MEPELDRLTPGQQRLWPELATTPRHFTLYGGIALALRFRHRHSVDFDFISRQSFDPELLYREIPYLNQAEVLQMESNTLTCLVVRDEPVKLSFFGVPSMGVVAPAEVISGTGINVASLIDIAGTKASVIQKRAAHRDYLDLDVILTQGRLELLDALAAGKVVYGPMFNPQLTLKAMSFFGDGDLERIPEDVQERLLKAVRGVDLRRLPARIAELQGAHGD